MRRELRLRGVDEALVRAVLDDRRRGAEDATADDDEPIDADRAAADRLLARHDRSLARVADPRVRRQRAYALLARNGFDPSTAGEASRALIETPDPDEPEAPPDG